MERNVDVRENQTEQDTREHREAEREIAPEKRSRGEADEMSRTTVAAPTASRKTTDMTGEISKASGEDNPRTSLFEEDRAAELRNRWSDLQVRFVDDPHEAVKGADALVAEVIRELSSVFSAERSSLEGQWGRDRQVSTEDMRVALRRYRTLFDRLLSK